MIFKKLSKGILFLSAFCSTTYAGDYSLVIADTNDTCKYPKAFLRDDNAQQAIKTPSEVSDDLKRLFRGEKNKIRILTSSLTNGHRCFCTSRGRRTVEQTLIEIIQWDTIVNENELYEFFLGVGSEHLLDEITDLLKSDLSPQKMNRIKKAYRVVKVGLDALKLE